MDWYIKLANNSYDIQVCDAVSINKQKQQNLVKKYAYMLNISSECECLSTFCEHRKRKHLLFKPDSILDVNWNIVDPTTKGFFVGNCEDITRAFYRIKKIDTVSSQLQDYRTNSLIYKVIIPIKLISKDGVFWVDNKDISGMHFVSGFILPDTINVQFVIKLDNKIIKIPVKDYTFIIRGFWFPLFLFSNHKFSIGFTEVSRVNIIQGVFNIKDNNVFDSVNTMLIMGSYGNNILSLVFNRDSEVSLNIIMRNRTPF